MLRNFIHATAVIMAGSGMKEVLASSFGSVDKMLWKEIPTNVLCPLDANGGVPCSELQIQGVTSFDLLIQVLDAHSSGSRTPKIWIDNLVEGHHNDELLLCWT